MNNIDDNIDSIKPKPIPTKKPAKRLKVVKF